MGEDKKMIILFRVNLGEISCHGFLDGNNQTGIAMGRILSIYFGGGVQGRRRHVCVWMWVCGRGCEGSLPFRLGAVIDLFIFEILFLLSGVLSDGGRDQKDTFFRTHSGERKGREGRVGRWGGMVEGRVGS